MEDYLYRRIVFRSTDEYGVPISAERTRSTDGHASIVVRCDRQSIEFSTELFGDSYEIIAREVCELLDKAVMNNCELPEPINKEISNDT